MPRQSARAIVLLCAFIGLVGSPGIVPGDVAGDREVLERITGQIHHDQRLEGTQVQVVVQGGHVALSGTVDLYRQKLLYEHIVGRTPGVVKLKNDLRVVPRLPVEDTEIARHIHILITVHQRFQHTEIMVDVTEGVVNLSGTFYDPNDVLFLRHQVAEIEGVIRLEIRTRYAT
jgi:osmotically-inducible protein OsmY